MFHLVGFIIFGFIVGLIARAVTPGQNHMTLTMTAILGVVGSIVAGWLGRALGWYGPEDGAGFIMSTVGAVVVITAYHFMARRRVLPGARSGVTGRDDQNFPRRAA